MTKIRENASVIGKTITPTTTSAPGIWSINAVQRHRLSSNFPSSFYGYDANVAILLHCNGTNGSTTFTDVTGKTWTSAGGPSIATAQSVFGGASGNAAPSASTGVYLSTPDHSSVNLSNSDFAIDLRLRIATNGNIALGSQRGGAGNDGWIFSYISGTDLRFNYTSDGTNFLGPVTFAWTPSTNTWYHIALTRSGANLRCFVDGTQIGSTYNISATTIFNSTASYKIFGDAINSYTFNAYIDEYRLSVGVPRWTANFTPQGFEYS